LGFVDLHSHVLPALDDGAPVIEASVALVEVLLRMGYEAVYATPHQKVGFFTPSADDIAKAHARVRAALDERGVTIALHLGAENFWDELFLARAQKKQQPAYTGGCAFLFELPVRVTPPRLEETLFQFRVGGLLPVMAHPERYAPFWDRFERYEEVRRSTALLVDLGALDGAHGKRECTTARRLVEDGLAHAAASDVHTVEDARAAGAGIAWIRKRCGDAAVKRLLDENPRRILQGDLPD
jgi:protein-tyrosine phosphatase